LYETDLNEFADALLVVDDDDARPYLVRHA
jgi:hypothetical protein